jgi:hypothetical protein
MVARFFALMKTKRLAKSRESVFPLFLLGSFLAQLHARVD